MTDKQLQLEVLQELEFEPEVNSARIGVAVEHGVVTLSGRVHCYPQKLAAERAARRVYSAKAVVDDLEVVLSARDEVPEEDLARAAVQTVEALAILPPDTVRITVRDSHLVLEGTVEWQFQRQAAEHAVRHLRGVRGVLNHINLKPHPAPDDAETRLQAALQRSLAAEGNQVKIQVEDHTVTLCGTVRSLNDREAAVHAAWRMPGVTRVEDCLVVAP